MITCLIGTRAQLIKMAPIMRELEARKYGFNLVFTGQHKVTMDDLLKEFEIATVPLYVYQGKEITGIAQMGLWFVRVLWRLLRFRDRYFPRAAGEQHVVLVHGDTFSTLVGAVAGRLCGVKVAHVESGLRSFRMFHPFPEEVTRLLVFSLSDIAFCPNAWAINNLRRWNTLKLDCGGNTLIDSVRFALAKPESQKDSALPGAYGVISLHRFENIFDRAKFTSIISLIEMVAEKMPVVFVLHPATENKLIQFDLMQRLTANRNFFLRKRMGYIAFLKLLTRATFVVTDGGSNQEELSYLGIPTLLMREATERMEGLDDNVVVARYDAKIVRNFLDALNPVERSKMQLPPGAPSRFIVDSLTAYTPASR